MDELRQQIPLIISVVLFLGIIVTYLAGTGTKARRDVLEKNNTDLQQALDIRTRERDEARQERDACLQELNALGRVVTAADAIGRFEHALADHRSELLEALRGLRELVQRCLDLILSFRQQGNRREH